MSELAQFNPNSFDELTRFAEMVSRTQAIPQAYQGKPDDIVATVIMGADLGLSPMQSLQNIAVIRGKPTVWGDGLLAICQSHPNFGGITEWLEDNGTPQATAHCCVKRRAGDEVIETVRTFSVDQAKRASLWGNKGPWSQYPERMLQMRARGFACRDAFADALRGIMPREEVMDYNNEPVVVQKTAPEEVKAVLLPPEAKPKKLRTAAANKKAMTKVAKSFAEAGITDAQLLTHLNIEDPLQFTEAMQAGLREVFKQVSRGQYPDSLAPAHMVSCSADAPPPPSDEMAGFE